MLVDEVAARVEHVRADLNDRVTTLAETTISRHDLGEALVALGAQLLGAAVEESPPDQAAEADAEERPAKTGSASRPKGRKRPRE